MASEQKESQIMATQTSAVPTEPGLSANAETKSGGFNWRLLWDFFQFALPIAFTAAIFMVCLPNMNWAAKINVAGWMDYIGVPTHPTTPEGGAKLMAWLNAIPMWYALFSVIGGATHPSGQYWKSTVDLALSLIPAFVAGVFAVVAVIAYFQWPLQGEFTLDVYQKKFLWTCAIASILDIGVNAIVARRVGMQWGVR